MSFQKFAKEGTSYLNTINWQAHQKDLKQDSVGMGLNEENYPVHPRTYFNFLKTYLKEQLLKDTVRPYKENPTARHRL